MRWRRAGRATGGSSGRPGEKRGRKWIVDVQTTSRSTLASRRTRPPGWEAVASAVDELFAALE